MTVFQLASFFVAALCILKAGVALAFPLGFYGWRKGQYAAKRPHPGLFVLPLSALAFGLLTLSAEPVPFGWVVTAFLFLSALLGAISLLGWRRHHRSTAERVEGAKTGGVRSVDIGILSVGLVFLSLGLFVY